ncbi:2Fe-2S iron-sulfur cluster-binding protein [Marinospirillum perlucidum]|uniref:2Fe-2S iron-sulfur cluster-binding protein n=1 Tax=Marinospirillum perlucidum TaxID=1982602 RepID=UPI001390357E|nr:2Fe-2S iron-sulfur cluster-binding protein [Marinospirillum perlucidum]
MSSQIDVQGQVLPASCEKPLLDALQDAGVTWRESCRNGVCGVCACYLTQGKVDYRQRQPHALTAEAIEAGQILPCIAFPSSTHLTLDAPLYPAPETAITSL